MKWSILLFVLMVIVTAPLGYAKRDCDNWLKCKPDMQIEFREYKFLFADRETFKCYMKDVTLFKHKLLTEYGYDIPVLQ